MSILVLDGAGYIGSHAVDQLINKGYQDVVVDNLQTGHKEVVHKEATFYQGNIRDKEFLKAVLSWKPQYTDTKIIIKTAWAWHVSHLNGYGE